MGDVVAGEGTVEGAVEQRADQGGARAAIAGQDGQGGDVDGAAASVMWWCARMERRCRRCGRGRREGLEAGGRLVDQTDDAGGVLPGPVEHDDEAARGLVGAVLGLHGGGVVAERLREDRPFHGAGRGGERRRRADQRRDEAHAGQNSFATIDAGEVTAKKAAVNAMTAAGSKGLQV